MWDGGLNTKTRNKRILMEHFCKDVTFYKDFANEQTVDVGTRGVARGSPIATFTASRSATTPATYVDSNGVIQLVTTSDVPRFQGGYYDETGFHAGNSGIMIEAAGTNMFVSGTINSDTSVDDTSDTGYVENPAGTDRWVILVAADSHTTNSISTDSCTYGGRSIGVNITTDGGAASYIYLININTLTIVDTTVYTVSFWVKTSAAKTIPIVVKQNGGATNYGLDDTFTTVANTWIRVTKSFTANASVADAEMVISLHNNGTYNINIESLQFEASPYATSFIPTTTAALTRNAEVLKYEIANNRTAAAETIVVKFMPSSDFANDGISRFLIDTHSPERAIYKPGASSKIRGLHVENTSAYSNTTPLANISYTIATIFKQSSPYLIFYLDNILESTDIINNFTSPIWTSTFSIGTYNDGVGSYANCIFESIAFFNRALSASEVLALNDLM